MIDPIEQTMVELSRSYQNGNTTPMEVIDAYLARIGSFEPKLGSYQAVYDNDARMAAEAATKALQSGHRIGPFHGIPFALKDIIDVEGRLTTGGSTTMRNRISPTTATIARRLIAGGGILLGKTKTVEFAMGGWGTNQHMGTPWNPWDMNTHRTPGGSSAGSGVSVAARIAGCAVGTDTGGSVRLPAAWCGIVGLKVTAGKLPTDGIIPLSHSLDTPGPMTRTVADTVLMYETMAGREPLAIDRDLVRGDGFFGVLTQGVSGLRLGCLSNAEREGVDAEILALYDSSLERLRDLGAEIVPFEAPMAYEDMKNGAGVIIASEAYHHHGALFEANDARVDEDVRPRILAGRDIKAHSYIAALTQRLADQAAFDDSIRGLHAVLSPTIATQAIPIESADQSSTPARFTRAANYLSLCGLSVPMGLTADGLPGSLQIMARGHDEETAIRIGGAFETVAQATGLPELFG